MKKITLAVMTVVGLIGTQAAFAGDTGWYVFGAVGQLSTNNLKSDINNGVSSIGYTGFSSSFNNPTAYNLDLGYQMNKYLAFEGGYFGTNTTNYTASGGNLPRPLSLSFDASGWNAKVVGILPVADQFSLLGKVGVEDIRVSRTGGDFSKTDITYGIGAKYDFTENIAGRIDLDRYTLPGSATSVNENAWTVGIAYKF